MQRCMTLGHSLWSQLVRYCPPNLPLGGKRRLLCLAANANLTEACATISKTRLNSCMTTEAKLLFSQMLSVTGVAE